MSLTNKQKKFQTREQVFVTIPDMVSILAMTINYSSLQLQKQQQQSPTLEVGWDDRQNKLERERDGGDSEIYAYYGTTPAV